MLYELKSWWIMKLPRENPDLPYQFIQDTLAAIEEERNGSVRKLTSMLYCGQRKPMPVISMFYGIIIRMFYFDNARHRVPHIHVQYGD